MSSRPLVRLDRVDVDLAGTTVLHELDWQLMPGEHWGIVGANGSGKTSFLALIAGILWPAPDRGERRYDFGGGEQRDAVEARRRIVLVGHELQDRYARWNWSFSGLDVVLSGVYRTDVPRRRPDAAQRSRALRIMRRLDIAHLAERAFLQLSRGEQRRILIARGVAFEPAALLLDEPASGLDRDARLDLERLIESIAAHTTLVCSAHAPGDLPRTLTRVLHLTHGRITPAGNRGRTGISENRGQTAISAREPQLGSPSPKSQSDPDFPKYQSDPELPLVEIERADVWIGSRQVLSDITWRLDREQHWLIRGGNGAGKSSFLRLVHGQLRPARGGRVRWPALGDPRNVWDLRRQVAWLSPELQAAYRYPTSVRECVASGFDSSVGLTRGLTPVEAARVTQLLEQFTLIELAERNLATLSYGQARRALIARALVNRPSILLLDEPWEGLDRPMAALLNEQLAAVAAQGTALVCASHLTTYTEQFTHELVLDRGRIAANGAPAAQ